MTCCVLKRDEEQNVKWQSRSREGWRFNGAEHLKVALQASSVVLQFFIASLIIYFWGEKFNLQKQKVLVIFGFCLLICNQSKDDDEIDNLFNL